MTTAWPVGGRPRVSVVMPFAGTTAEAALALTTLAGLTIGTGDELILVDNSGTALPGDGVVLVRADGERSPSHARNAGAERARGEWLLFLDADCRAPADLLDRFLSDRVPDDVGALAGAVVPAPGAAGLASRYGASKSFLNQDAHLAHGFLPRAIAANLLVRRTAFEAVGGFYEGVRAAEDTDFSWRLQRAGWRLAARPQARVEHTYRTSVGALRRQWRGYAAGRAWLARRYDGFAPEPAVRRAATRALSRGRGRRAVSPPPPPPPPPRPPPGAADEGVPAAVPEPPVLPPATPSEAPSPRPLDRGRFLALDALLGIEELAGLTLSNRPRHEVGADCGRVRVVLVADRFPVRGDPLAEFALSLADVRVEAAARPDALDREAFRALAVAYREDDGAAARAGALLRLLARHPLRCARDLATRWRSGWDAPGLAAIAPAVIRLQHDAGARVHPLGGPQARAVAARQARLAGRRLND